MAEVDAVGLYPHATPDGAPIPFEIIRPLGLIKQDFGAAAVNDIAIPAAAGFLVLRATEACYVRFDGVAAAIPANGTHTPSLVFVDAGEVVVIDHNSATEFSVIRATTVDGILRVQTITKYTDVRKTAIIERG